MNPPPPPECEALNAEAKQFMQRGIQLLSQTGEAELTEALECFEKALAMRQRLPIEQYPYYRWVLCAAWMNRADALTRLGGEQRCLEAVRCYDVAISHLHRLPQEMEVLRRWRLGVAWVNRGITLKALDTPKTRDDAVRSFDCALQVMREHLETPRLDYQQVLASAWMNRATVQAEAEGAALVDACENARSALRYSRPLEGTDPVLAEVGLKARHVLCRTLATLLEAPAVNPKTAEEWIFEATDAVEEVLQLAKGWEGSPVSVALFRGPLLDEIFHFGCRIYRAFQPHFLAEFLMEGIDDRAELDETRLKAAREALSQVTAQIRAEGLLSKSPEKLDRLLLTLENLATASERLNERAAEKTI